MDCYFRQYWRDQRLSFLGPIKSLSLSIKMLERIWRPDTYFYNGKNSYVHTITVPNKLLRISQDGDILYSMRWANLHYEISIKINRSNSSAGEVTCPWINSLSGFRKGSSFFCLAGFTYSNLRSSDLRTYNSSATF